MKRLVVMIAAALLASPAVASAKGPIEAASVCGTDGCNDVVLPAAAGKPEGMMLLFGTQPSMQPPPGAYYRLRVSAGSERMALFYAAGKVGDGSSAPWAAVSEPLRSAIDRALAGRSPYRFEIGSVFVDGRKSSRPDAFASIFGTLPPAAGSNEISRHSDRWETVQVMGAESTPWTSVTVFYDPPTGSIGAPSGSRWLEAPASVRSEIDRMIGRSSAGATPGDSSRRPLWLGLGALLGSGAIVAAWLWRRSRPRPARIA
jgi:hypothetical protein